MGDPKLRRINDKAGNLLIHRTSPESPSAMSSDRIAAIDTNRGPGDEV
jgi:hypothetical protein